MFCFAPENFHTASAGGVNLRPGGIVQMLDVVVRDDGAERGVDGL